MNYYNKYTFNRQYYCPCGNKWKEEFVVKWRYPDDVGPTSPDYERYSMLRSSCSKCKNIIPPAVCPECNKIVTVEKRDWIGSSLDDTAYEQEKIFIKCPDGHEYLVAERFDSEK